MVKVKVKVPEISGYDLSHRNSGTEICGQLTPLLCQEVIPASPISCKVNIVTQLPPLVSDTYMNVRKKIEAFFVPSRLLSASFEDWFCDFPKIHSTATAATTSSRILVKLKSRLPVIRLTGNFGLNNQYLGAGSLLDYLGFKVDNLSGVCDINPLPIIAYHMIWQEYYRNPKVTNPAFAPSIGDDNYTEASLSFKRLVSLPYTRFYDGDSSVPSRVYIEVTADQLGSPLSVNSFLRLGDGTNFFDLRQRNFGFDCFTVSNPSPQMGEAAKVDFTVDQDAGSISIAQIRAGNSLQMFRERNNLPSPRLVDQVKARYNADLSDGVAQRPIFIGSATYDIVSRGVDQTAGVVDGANPFNSVASQYGRAFGAGSDFIIDRFVANEPGYIMILQSIVPEVSYTTGVDPMFFRYTKQGSIVEMATPLLQNVGDEPIMASELYCADDASRSAIFAYRQRYGSFMFKPNVVHGLFRDPQSLNSFVLSRGFVSSPVQGTDFLQIPKNYMDQVLAVSETVAGVTGWYDAKIDLHIGMPLNEYSIPSLQDPAYEHGQTVLLRRNGQVF